MFSVPGYQIKEQPEGGPLYESRRSVVYQGIRQLDSLPVVLKLLNQDHVDLNEVAEFRNEYEMTRSLQGDGVIGVYGLEFHHNQWVMVLEDFGGESLAKLKRSGFHFSPESSSGKSPHSPSGVPASELPASELPASGALASRPPDLEIQEFLKVAIRITEILGQLHQQNVTHKDINPSNILYNFQTGQIKLIDFGIATSLSKESSARIPPTILEGTLLYMSPEQTGRMNRALDYRTDLYSLGATFYELLTGHPPFQAEETIELIHYHLAKLPIPPHQLNGEIPVFLSEIVLKLMAKHAEDRYQSTFGLKKDLETCLSRLATTDTKESFSVGAHDISDRFQIPQKLYGREKEIESLLATFERVGRNLPQSPIGGGTILTTDGADGPIVGPAQGAKEMVLVTGFTGIGKSSLVHEIHKPIVEKQGYFISGKFEQFKRDIPFASLIDAFRGLIRQLLNESENRVEVWKQKLQEALGINGRVIIGVIPEVELIVGLQPPITDLPRTESQNRFNYVFQNFIRALSTPEHPLTIFLDDLQWADPASLQLLELFMSDPETRGLLLIGAYRKHEIDAQHVLISTLETIQEAGVDLHTIHLLPLPLEIVRQLIADTFQCSFKTAQDLARVCFEKTQGNPFFLEQFLHALYVEGLVKFNVDQQKWQWRIETIYQANITDNVVELMAGKIKKLPQEPQQVLQWAACLGNSFELNTLALIHERSPEEIMIMLWDALQEGLILSDTAASVSQWPVRRSGINRSGYSNSLGVVAQTKARTPEARTPEARIPRFKFSHDRIQEAVYSLLEEAERASIHLKIGRLLLKHTPPKELEENPFDVVIHWNQAWHLIVEDSERRRLAELNLQAGRRAKKTLAYSAAVSHLKTGITILLEAASSEDCTNSTPTPNISVNSFLFTLQVELAEAHYLNTDFEAANQLYPLLLKTALSDQNKYIVYSIQLEQLMIEGKYSEAIEVVRHALELLDIEVPRSPAETSLFIEKELAAFPHYLAGRKIKDLARETKKSSQQEEQQLRLLSSLSTSARFTSKNQLITWTALKAAALCLQHGHNEFAPFSYITYANFVLARLLKDYKNAHEYGKMAVVLSEKYGNLSYQGRAYYTFAAFINPLKNPFSDSLPALRKAIQFCTEGGDFAYAGYAIGILSTCQIISGQELSNVHQELEKYIPFIKRTNRAFFEDFLRPVVLQVLKNLTGMIAPGTFSDSRRSLDTDAATGTLDHRFDEQAFLQKNQIPMFLAHFYCAKIRSLTLYGQHENALQYLDKVEMVSQALPSLMAVGEAYFYMSLTLTAILAESEFWRDRYAETSEVEYHQILETYQTKMKRWAEHTPANFEHKYLLSKAESSKKTSPLTKVMGLYKQGIRSAQKYGFLNMEALGNELYARFWLEKGEVEFAKIYLCQAYRLYQQWGATGKVRQLENNDPELLRSLTSIRNGRTNSRTTSGHDSRILGALDLDALINASQALSQEINLEKLLGRLMWIIVENAGAQKGFLLLKKDDQLLIEGLIDAEKAAGLPGSHRNGRPIAPAVVDDCNRRLQPVIATSPSKVRIQEDTPQEWQLPLSIARFVIRTGELVRIDEASGWQDFSKDPYFTHTHPQAILCIPLKQKEQIAGVLYLENDIMSGVFTEDRVQMLETLLAQAAISIENARLYDHLEELVQKRTQALERTYRQIQSDLQVAGEFQQSVLPLIPQVSFLKTTVKYDPFDQVSGDVYDVYTDQEGALNIFLGDAIGHGIAAAFMTMMVHIGLDTLKNEESSVNETLSKLNEILIPRIEEKFVTGVFFKVTPGGQINISNAGHPPLLILPADGSELVKLNKAGMPLGVFNLPYQLETYQLQEGDKFFVYTDGWYEWPNKEDRIFRHKRLCRFFEENRDADLEAIPKRLLETLKQFSQGVPCNDDRSILGFQYTQATNN